MTDSPIPPSSEPTPPPGAVPPPQGLNYGTESSTNYVGPVPDKDSVTMGMLCHLLGIFTLFIGPLIIWLIKKDTSPFVDDQGKEALNFQITCAIAFFCCIPLNFLFCLGALIAIGIAVARIVLGIIATVNANKGIAYRYPINWRLVK